MSEEPGKVDRYTVITLCGSMRFRTEFDRLEAELTLAGHVVLTPTDLAATADPSAEERAQLGRVHLQKVAMADEILVVNVGTTSGRALTGRSSMRDHMGSR